MDHLPNDPAILVSSINMLLRDEEFDTLEALCYSFNTDPEELKARLLRHGYVYSERQHQMRPIGYDAPSTVKSLTTIPRDSVETAFSFFHQKHRIYVQSSLDWQKDDIECAVGDYADQMNRCLLMLLSSGRPDFLHTHNRFLEDVTHSLATLSQMMESYKK